MNNLISHRRPMTPLTLKVFFYLPTDSEWVNLASH